MPRRSRDRPSGHVQALMLLALAIAALGVIALLAATVRDRYHCAERSVAAIGPGGGPAGGCEGSGGVAAPSAIEAPAAQRAGAAGIAAGEPSIWGSADPGGSRRPTPAPRSSGALGAVIWVGERIVHGALSARDASNWIGRRLTQPLLRAARSRAEPGLTRDQLIEVLVRPAGNATATDVAAARAVLAKLPDRELRDLYNSGVTIKVTNETILEAVPALKGVRTGYEDDTAEDMAAVNQPWPNQIVIPGDRVEKHLLHEVGHSMHEIRGRDQYMTRAFRDAAERDRDLLGPYNAHSLAETYAESFGDYFSDSPRYPNLYRYWDCKLAGRGC
jgi:hypothetical protein